MVRLAILALLLPTAAVAQRAPSQAASAADKFSLELPPGDESAPAAEAPLNAPAAEAPADVPAASVLPAADAPASAPSPAAPEPASPLSEGAAPPPEAPATPTPAVTFVPAAAPAPTPGTPTRYSLDTPIAALIADPAAKAVLDRNLPGLSDDANLDKFRALSLRQLAPLSGGQLTPELMTKAAFDLAALTAGGAPARPKARKEPAGR